MGWARIAVALGTVTTMVTLCALAGCHLSSFGGCDCQDGYPPTWSGTVALPSPSAGQPASCTATITRGENVISFDIEIDRSVDGATPCTKNGGSDGGLCNYETSSRCSDFDGGAPWCSGGYEVWTIFLNPEDESYLGGFDFDLSVSCDGTVIRQSHEVFLTRECEC